MFELIEDTLKGLPGNIGFFYRNLVTGETHSYNEDCDMMAASVIKLFIMLDAFRRIEEGTLDKDMVITMKRDDCVPSCGALTYMHDGLKVTVEDLYTLMIILSDNTATNVMIDILGFDSINDTILAYGFTKTRLNRKMFDKEKSDKGIQNYISAREVGELLTMMYEGRAVSPKASEEMLRILSCQRLNGKIPFILHSYPEYIRIAHKTGEDTGITHDVGIVYSGEPFVVCFCGNDTCVYEYERVMADISKQLYDMHPLVEEDED